ncbi:MAG: pyridoxamine 5'-phosphate oxidase family protein, partial [Pseudomonadota bacterium]
PLAAEYPEALFMVQVQIEEIWVNCPRYIHPHRRLDTSRYVPQEGKDTPIPAWKRIDFVQDALPAKDQGKAEAAGGLIDQAEYESLVGKGEA